MQGNFANSPNGPGGQNRNASLENRNQIGSRNGKTRQNAAISLAGYSSHMNNTSQDVTANGSLLQGQNLT